MRDTEDRVDRLRIRRPDVQLQQRGLQRVESFEALVEEGVVELCEVERHGYLSSTRCTVAISCAGSNGLTIQPVAPALLPSRLRSAELSVVSIRIGVWLYCGSARSARITSKPSRSGMFTSSRTRSNEDAAASRSASSPSAADVTSKPALLSDILTISR